MDRIDGFYVKAEAWLNKHILRMSDDANKDNLLNTFSGAGKKTDEEFRSYILSLFSQ
jgi:hypothetical protein